MILLDLIGGLVVATLIGLGVIKYLEIQNKNPNRKNRK